MMRTTQKITDLLNQEALTITEVAIRLKLSRNCVHQHVTNLHAVGAVLQLPPDTLPGVGKPAHLYRTAPRKEDIHSEASKPVLESLIQTISKELPTKKRISVLENTGRSLAKAAGLQTTGNLKANIKKSVDTVNALGAIASIRQEDKKFKISCYSCPVANLVHNEPLTCHMVAAFFSEATGKKVAVECRKDETVVCGFSIE